MKKESFYKYWQIKNGSSSPNDEFLLNLLMGKTLLVEQQKYFEESFENNLNLLEEVAELFKNNKVDFLPFFTILNLRLACKNVEIDNKELVFDDSVLEVFCSCFKYFNVNLLDVLENRDMVKAKKIEKDGLGAMFSLCYFAGKIKNEEIKKRALKNIYKITLDCNSSYRVQCMIKENWEDNGYDKEEIKSLITVFFNDEKFSYDSNIKTSLVAIDFTKIEKFVKEKTNGVGQINVINSINIVLKELKLFFEHSSSEKIIFDKLSASSKTEVFLVVDDRLDKNFIIDVINRFVIYDGFLEKNKIRTEDYFKDFLSKLVLEKKIRNLKVETNHGKTKKI